MTIDATLPMTDVDAEESELFGTGVTEPPPVSSPTTAPPPEKPKKRPGPPANPNSQRQKRIAAATKRAKTAPTPPKRAKANEPYTPVGDTYRRGALAVIGWVARPLAAAGMALEVAARAPIAEPEGPRRDAAIRKRRHLAMHGQALSLDAFTLDMHHAALVDGLAATADHLPWMAQVLERAARLSPFASLLEAGTAILLQVAVNHRVMPSMPAAGTLSPEEMVDLLRKQAAE